ncbi:MAG: ABC transporter substrate-binding protein, partial [Magnetococcales bacterium]|nr:ABC transporter substrate-binding protein [Magnetococcales bacterium]
RQKVTLQLQWKHQFEFAGFYAALDKGYYRQAGMDVEIQEYEKGMDIQERVVSGQATFGIYYAAIIRGRMEGKPILLLASYMKRSPLVLVTRPDIYFPGELKGKRVMGEQGELSAANMMQMFKRYGITLEDFIVVPHSFNVDDFASGQVDAMTVFLTNEVYNLQQRKISYNVLDPNSYGTPFYDVNLFTSEQFAAANPETTAAFVRASTRGWYYALEHPEEIVELILRKYNTQNKSREHLLFEAQETRRVMQPGVYPIGAIIPEHIRKIQEVFVETGFAKIVIDPESFIFSADGRKRVQEKTVVEKDGPRISLTQPEEGYLIQKGRIFFCADPHWLPFEGIGPQGEYTGIVADFITLVAERVGIPFTLFPTRTWQASIEAVKKGDCDLLTATGITEERKKFLNFSIPYFSFPMVIAVSEEQAFIADMNDVGVRTVGLVRGYAHEELIREKYPQLNIRLVDNVVDGLEHVLNGKVFGFADTPATISYAIHQNQFSGLKIGGKLDIPVRFSLASAKNAPPELAAILNKVVISFSEQEKKKLLDKWFSIRNEPSINYALVYKILAAILGLLAWVLFWNRKLTRFNDSLKKANREVMVARNAAEEANQAKSIFLATMSHEIRTPLNAILGMGEILAETTLTASQSRCVTTLNKSGEALLSLINDILDLSKIEAGQVVLESMTFDLRDFLAATLELFSFSALDKGILLTSEIDKEVPRIVEGDTTRLRQVLLNLIGNAIKFTERGEVILRVAPGDDPKVSFAVIDSGKGIPQERQQDIFQPFTQADSSITRKHGGTGLGLTISQRLVVLMGGEIGLTSVVGHGSTFLFSIPLPRASDEMIPHQSPGRHYPPEEVLADRGTSNSLLTILLAEDTEENRLVVQTYLQNPSCMVLEAENGREAVRLFQSTPCDLVLMDIQMPEMDGYEATRQIRAWEISKGLPPTPIIALTAHAMNEESEKIFAAGCNLHLTKPIRKIKLLAAIESFFPNRIPPSS